MVHENYKNSKNIIEAFSEDWAEIRSAVYQHLHEDAPARQLELDKILDDIYTGLYMNCSPVILIDKDGSRMEEYK